MGEETQSLMYVENKNGDQSKLFKLLTSCLFYFKTLDLMQ